MAAPRIIVTKWLLATYRHSFGVIFPTACKHYPSCSVYAEQAIVAHGFIRGSILAARRITRCHPLSKGGFDPVPTSRGQVG